MTRPLIFSLWIGALSTLACCAAPAPQGPTAPIALTTPAPAAADVQKVAQHNYWAGYAAGRHDQKQQDALAGAAASPPPSPVVSTAAVAPLPAVAPPADGYSAAGPARPVGTH